MCLPKTKSLRSLPRVHAGFGGLVPGPIAFAIALPEMQYGARNHQFHDAPWHGYFGPDRENPPIIKIICHPARLSVTILGGLEI